MEIGMKIRELADRAEKEGNRAFFPGAEKLEQIMRQGYNFGWTDERAKVYRRAMSVYHRIWEIVTQKDKVAEIVRKANEWWQVDTEGRALSRELTALIWDELGALPREMHAWLVHGTIAGETHGWITIEGDPKRVHAGGQIVAADQPDLKPEDYAKAHPMGVFRYIIDCYAPECYPEILLLSPFSYYQAFYTEHERFELHPDPPVEQHYVDVFAVEREAMLKELKDLSRDD